jgi:peptide chain release factor
MFPVEQDKEDELLQRMAALRVKEADIEEKFVRSGGHGGQNVNKVASCVMLTHVPTGLQVKCQTSRQQGMNRYIARKLLLNKIETARNSLAAARRAQREKLRRQKRKRSRAAKERILTDKRHQSDKKANRRRVTE